MFTKEELALMLKVINNLYVYTSDDDQVEMHEDEAAGGMPDFEADVDELAAKLRGMV